MLKYVKAVFRGAYKILFAYPRIRKYAKNKDKYPLEERYNYTRKIINLIFKCFKTEIDVEGFDKIDLNDNYLIVCNHQAFTDALALISLFEKPMSIVSKKEAMKYPLVGKAIYFIDSIFIDRDNIKDAVRIIRKCKEDLNDGKNLLIFPEGTRTKDSNYMTSDYKAGALKSAYDTKKKIAVFVIDGSYKVLSAKYRDKQKVTIKVVEIIDPSVYESKNTIELADYIKEVTNNTLKEIRQQ